MYLAIITRAGIPLKRDILEEILRRAKERGAVSEDNLRAAMHELESELERYARRLVDDPQWGEVVTE